MTLNSVSHKQLLEMKKRLRKSFFTAKKHETIPINFDLCQVEAEIKRRKSLKLRMSVRALQCLTRKPDEKASAFSSSNNDSSVRPTTTPPNSI